MNESDVPEWYGEPLKLTGLMKVICVAFYSILGILAVYGNLLVVLVILWFRQMRTATNILILNLAIADLLIAIFCVPFSYWSVLIFDDQRWVFGAPLCSVLAFLQGTAVFLSSWTLVVISFDRWMAIMFVLTPGMRITRYRALTLVLGTWGASLLMAVPLLVVSRIIEGEDGVARCDEDWSIFGENIRQIYQYLVLTLQYLLPQTVLIITYTFIGCKMWNSRVPGSKKANASRHESVKKLIPMVILVSALFGACWLPILAIFNILIPLWPEFTTWQYCLYTWWFAHALAMSHSIVNPIVYYVRNSRFREGFLYFSRFLPWVHFKEFRLLADNGRTHVSGVTNSSVVPRSEHKLLKKQRSLRLMSQSTLAPPVALAVQQPRKPPRGVYQKIGAR